QFPSEFVLTLTSGSGSRAPLIDTSSTESPETMFWLRPLNSGWHSVGGRRHALLRVALFFADNRGNGLQPVVLVQIDEFDALRVPARLADIFHEGPHHLAAHGNQHDLVLVFHRERAHRRAGFFGRFHRDDAFAAPRLFAVFLETGPFADAVLTRHEQRRVGND